MAIKTAEVKIKGLTALLMHRFPLEPIEAIAKKSIEEQAEIAAYRDPNGSLYIPGISVQRALVGGATYSKGKGRSSLQKPVAACVMVTPEYLDLGTKEFKIDSRRVVIQATKSAIVRHRPRIEPGWQVSFNLEWDPTLLTETEMRQVVDDTGSRVGLLDFRPERKGPFGRFMVTEWKCCAGNDMARRI